VPLMFAHVAVVQQAVEDGGGRVPVAKHLAPSPKLLILVMIMVPRSQRRVTSRKTMLASARSKGR
jgi:hypothetical protein